MATSILVQQIQALAQRAATEDKLIKGLLVTAEGAIRTDFAAADTLLGGRITTLDTKVDTAVDTLELLVDTTRTGIEADFNGKIGDVTALTTAANGNIVLAVNEVRAAITAAQNAAAELINDTAPSLTTVYSATKTDQQIKVAVDSVVDGATDALNTLKELSAALGDDADFASTVTESLGKRISVGEAQVFTAPQLAQAQSNMDVFSKAQVTAMIKAVTDTIGDVSSLDAVATFDAALVDNLPA